MLLIIGLGVIMAVAIFAAFMWSGYQAYFNRGTMQWLHGISAAVTLAGMASLSAEAVLATLVSGIALIISAGVAIIKEDGWSKLFPIVQVFFGFALASGIPLAGMMG